MTLFFYDIVFYYIVFFMTLFFSDSLLQLFVFLQNAIAFFVFAFAKCFAKLNLSFSRK